MGLDKIDTRVIERIAPNKGPTSSIDYNATMEEVRGALVQLSLAWNNQLHPLLDTLPGGFTGVNRDERTETPDPFINGFDGTQLFTDLTSTSITDDGRFYNDDKDRPITLKETFNKIQDQLNQSIQDLEVQIARVDKQAAITPRQRQAIGSRIFDPGASSSPVSLDGKTNYLERAVDQLERDLSGTSDYITGSGSQELTNCVFDQIKAIQDAHFYDENFNTMSHDHLTFHKHRYSITPDGALDGANIEYYVPGGEEFITGSLRVVINGFEQPRTTIIVAHANNKGFRIVGRDPLEADGTPSDDYLWIHYDIASTGV